MKVSEAIKKGLWEIMTTEEVDHIIKYHKELDEEMEATWVEWYKNFYKENYKTAEDFKIPMINEIQSEMLLKDMLVYAVKVGDEND